MATPVPISMLIALCDAIAIALNAQKMTLPFKAATFFAPINDLADVKLGDPVKVYLIPASDPESRMGGGVHPRFNGDYSVDMVIYARVGAGDTAETNCRSLMDLRQQLRDFLKPACFQIQGVRPTKVTLKDIDADPAYGVNVLIDKEVFVSAITLNFEVPT